MNNIEDEIEKTFLKFDTVGKRFGGNPKSHKLYLEEGYKAALQKQPNVSSEWISIEDKLPDYKIDERPVLWLRQDNHIEIAYGVNPNYYSHWMPLPAPPNETQSTGQSNESEDDDWISKTFQ